MAYTDDFAGRFPGYASAAAEPWRWAGNLVNDNAPTDDRPTRLLNPYLRIVKVNYTTGGTYHMAPNITSVARCPSDNQKLFTGPGGVRATQYEVQGTSYFFNAYGKKHPDPGNGLKQVKLGNVSNPSVVIIASDFCFNYSLAGSEFGYYPELKGPHQPGTCWGNAVFVDGHVNYVHFKEDATEYWHGDGWTWEAK
jgi:prepilin-type processing-associated H-X9-DG protein